jgi:chitin disaccharide deacetylase
MDSELLGFAPDARVLILNCDDLGMHEAVNVAIFDAIENGIATSCSLMAPCPAAADAIVLLRERPHVPFGLHLTLLRDSASYAWGPSSPKAEVASLLDPGTGELFTNEPVNRERLLTQARLDDVERELRAQLNTAVAAGLTPTHLDWHCLADGGRADIFELGLALAQEYGLAARVWLDDGRRKARALGKPVVDHAFLDSYTLDVDGKPETYERLLRALPAGLSEWAVHPALGTEDWQAIEPNGWRVRQSDHAFLTSGRAREVLGEEGIEVIDYTLLQNAWRGPLGTSVRGAASRD